MGDPNRIQHRAWFASGECLAFGPLTVRLEGGEPAAAVAGMFPLAASEPGSCHVLLEVSVGPRAPREWSAENPGGYTVDRGAGRITMEVADWTARFDLADRRTAVRFRDLWFPGVEQFLRVFVQTWLPLCGLGVAFHAAAVIHRGRGLLFPARAETGKSTVTRVLHEDGGTVLTEEMACCEVADSGVVVHSLPFRDRSGLNVRERLSVRLDRIYSLRQAAADRVVEVPLARRVLLLARNAAVGFREPELMVPALPLCADIARLVPVSVMEFALGRGFLRVI